MNTSACHLLAYSAELITKYVMELAEAEARTDNDRMVQYAHIRRAVMQTPGLAFLRDLVPEVRIFN